MFSLNGTLEKSGSVGRWETKQFIGWTNSLILILIVIWISFFKNLPFACVSPVQQKLSTGDLFNGLTEWI